MRTYAHINHTHYRRIPSAWPVAVHVGRTDISLDALTDPNCIEAVYRKDYCFDVKVLMEDLRSALATHPLRKCAKSSFMLAPFDIDIDSKTVNGVSCRMKVLWDGRNGIAA
jgi:hypothetical protein